MRPYRSRLQASAVILACSGLCAANALADVRFDITALGLTDSENRRDDGYISSGWTDYNDKGGVIGRTWRWSGSTWTGISAWFYENKVTTRIGLWDAAHVRSDGFAQSQPYSITSSNQVLGGSARYDGTYESKNVWVYSKGVTQTIGLIDALHTSTSGMQNTPAVRQNAAGQVAGYSTQYDGDVGAGETAWIYTDGETIPIGLRTGDALKLNGFTGNETEYLSESGDVAGWGNRYAPDGTWLGRDAWLYDGAQTISIGLFDTEHTSSIGKREARTMGINNNGDVIGYATRYVGGALPKGESAWIYRAGAATRLGLRTGIHVASDGGFVSEPTKINNTGQAAGWSTQFVGSAQGCSTWFFDGSTTRQIGLTGGIHTLSNGTGYSTVVALNDAGVVAGVSQQRFDGLSAFHYSDGVTTRIGLLDGKHVRSDGWSANTIYDLNSAGQITGIATRTNGYSGATGWFYDPGVNQTFSLEFSESSAGAATSAPQFLADDGVVLGTYVLYEGETIMGNHAFYWSMSKGFHDLGSIEAGGLGTQGWERLYDGIVISGNGDVILTGRLPKPGATGNLLAGSASLIPGVDYWGDVPVMLIAVPEPSIMGMLGLSGLLTLRVRPRRR